MHSLAADPTHLFRRRAGDKYTTFSKFPDLPAELQTLIWAHAIGPHRVLRVTLYQKDHPPPHPPSYREVGSAVYGPPWDVKLGCTQQLKEAARRTRDLCLVSKKVYEDVVGYILPDRMEVRVRVGGREGMSGMEGNASTGAGGE